MRVLITWGSQRGGTEGIAKMLADGLREEGVDVVLARPREALRATGFDAAIIGGALYGNRWHRDARRFVHRRARELRTKPVWLFSSGPLDDSAARGTIAPTRQVDVLMERIGAQGHVTFGGRLAPDAKGFPASAMAKTQAGDWRDAAQIRRWAGEIARALPSAAPRPIVAQKGRSLGSLVAHGAVGWAICAAVMGALLAAGSLTWAIALHALAVPLVFTLVARHYFRLRGARAPLPTALAFAALVALFDLVVVAGVAQRSLAMFASFAGTWLPLLLVFATTWATGAVMSTLPWPKPTPGGRTPAGAKA